MLATLTALSMLFVPQQGFAEMTGTAVARPEGKAAFNQETGSFFQVFTFQGKPPHSHQHATRMVKGYLHEGREGRLAHITSIQQHYFILMNFPELRNEDMWIGLRVVCGEPKPEPMWTDDTLLTESTFRGWLDGAQATYSRQCKGKSSSTVFPVFYEASDLGPRWNIGNNRTNIRKMIVEFPKPEEEEPLE